MPTHPEQYQTKTQDYLIKVILLGDTTTGKTNLLSRYLRGTLPKKALPTLGVDFSTKTTIYKERIVRAQIWDTAGQERFSVLNPSYIRGASAAIVVFDLTSRASFQSVMKHVECVQKVEPEIPIILVGNKSDLVGQRVVSDDEIQDLIYATPALMHYVEASATTDANVNMVFERAIHTVAQKMMDAETIIHVNPAPNPLKHREKLIDDLTHYIDRVESNQKNGQIDFAYGFWFYKNSRAINRQANYLLAKKLRTDLESSNSSIEGIFSDPKLARTHLISEKGLSDLDDYIERSINSSELNKIINAAQHPTKAKY